MIISALPQVFSLIHLRYQLLLLYINQVQRTTRGNYRPISIILPISKIIEKCLVERLKNFLSHHNILSDSQYGFRNKHSTEHALINFVDYVTAEKEDGKFVLGIYVDIKKAFDSVNHEILLNKLYKYGIRGVPQTLIKNYLSNRSQRVKLYDKHGYKILSNQQYVTCGVPQGSVLGPLLFLLFVNDMKNASLIFKAFTFADDTNLFISHHSMDELYASANRELRKIEDWLACNKLCPNIEKTCYQLYIKKQTDMTPLIYMHNSQIKRENIVKFLGVLVDESLSFREHIGHVCQKMTMGIGTMFRSREILEMNQLLTLYNALVLPHLNYCSLVWSINYETHMNRLLLLQKRAARVILGLGYIEPVTHRFKEIGIKPLSLLRDMKCMIMLDKIKHKMLPIQVNSIVEWKIPDQNQPQLRSTGPLMIPFALTVRRQHSLRVYASKLCNNLNTLSKINFLVPISKFKRTIADQLESLRWN